MPIDIPTTERTALPWVRPGRFLGKYPGTVVDVTPRQGLPSGSVQVEVPSLADEDPARPGRRPLQVWAMPCFPPGLYYVPDVGQPVWVEFVAGRLADPVWTGVWYADGKAPSTVAGQQPRPGDRVVHTTSGHVVELVDPPAGSSQGSSGSSSGGQDERAIRIRDATGSQVTLAGTRVTIEAASVDDAEVVLTAGNATITVHGASSGSTVSVAVGSSTTLELSADGVTISGSAVELNGPNGQGVALKALHDWFAGHTHSASLSGACSAGGTCTCAGTTGAPAPGTPGATYYSSSVTAGS
jgi:hypothetical protein